MPQNWPEREPLFPAQPRNWGPSSRLAQGHTVSAGHKGWDMAVTTLGSKHDLAMIRPSRGCSMLPLPRGAQHPPHTPRLPESRSQAWPRLCPQMSLRCGCWGEARSQAERGCVWETYFVFSTFQKAARRSAEGGWNATAFPMTSLCCCVFSFLHFHWLERLHFYFWPPPPCLLQV